MKSMFNQRTVRRRFEARELLNSIKSKKPCVDCGHKFHPCQMDFLRKDGSHSTVSRLLLRSKKSILAEIEICELVCANCGRLRLFKARREKRAGAV